MLHAPSNSIESVVNALQIYNANFVKSFNLNSNTIMFIKKIINNEEFDEHEVRNLNAWFKSHTYLNVGLSNNKKHYLWDLHGGNSAFTWSNAITNNALKLYNIHSHYRNGVFIRGYAQNRGKRTALNPETVSNAEKPVPNTVNYPMLYKRARVMARQKYGLLPNAYSNAYMIATYEKLVKQSGGGKPYSHVKSIYNDAQTVLSYELDESKKFSFEYLNDIQNWFIHTDKIIKE
jgi:hypothetical protein